MAIEVGLTSGGKTLLTTYTEFENPGLTTQGSKFIEDVTSGKWFIYDESVTGYVEMNISYQQLVNNFSSRQPERIRVLNEGVQLFLNDTAVDYGYDSIHDAISYYNSGITAWRNEAIAFNTWRDNTVTLMYDNIYSFTADGITLPSLTAGSFTGQAGYVPLGLTSPSRPII